MPQKAAAAEQQLDKAKLVMNRTMVQLWSDVAWAKSAPSPSRCAAAEPRRQLAHRAAKRPAEASKSRRCLGFSLLSSLSLALLRSRSYQQPGKHARMMHDVCVFTRVCVCMIVRTPSFASTLLLIVQGTGKSRIAMSSMSLPVVKLSASHVANVAGAGAESL